MATARSKVTIAIAVGVLAALGGIVFVTVRNENEGRDRRVHFTLGGDCRGVRGHSFPVVNGKIATITSVRGPVDVEVKLLDGSFLEISAQSIGLTQKECMIDGCDALLRPGNVSLEKGFRIVTDLCERWNLDSESKKDFVRQWNEYLLRGGDRPARTSFSANIGDKGSVFIELRVLPTVSGSPMSQSTDCSIIVKLYSEAQ